MPNFRVLIVDDEPISRRRLRRLLALEPECELVSECENGREAVQALGREDIDILFLDVQMPEMDGFEVVHAISRAHPLIIFTSAYDEYALKAFDVHAFDYLLKPFDRRRFRESIERARRQLAQAKPAISDDRILTLFENLTGARNAPDRIAVRNNGRVIFLKLSEIDWIEAADNYVCLHTGRETHVLRETMSELEARLDPARFIRVHRSAIVNLDCIKELQPWFRGDYKVMLHNGTELTLTKNHREKLESRLLLGAR
jgi:two-component system LytT family response regulator